MMLLEINLNWSIYEPYMLNFPNPKIGRTTLFCHTSTALCLYMHSSIERAQRHRSSRGNQFAAASYAPDLTPTYIKQRSILRIEPFLALHTVIIKCTIIVLRVLLWCVAGE